MRLYSLIVLANAFLVLNGLPRNRWESLERRLLNSSEDEDIYSLRSFHKPPFDEFQRHRYCDEYQEHYWGYCIQKNLPKDEKRPEAVKFCIDYTKSCETDGNQVPAIPPPLPKNLVSLDSVLSPKLPAYKLKPTMDSPVAFDLPLSASSQHSIPAQLHLTPEIVKSCTADCTLPHCTTECKCINQHSVVHNLCNPPPDGDLVDICKKWYDQCPMFQPVSY